MGYCIASDRITLDGLKVGYMYREYPDNEQDSGWRFFAGDEDEEYTNYPNKTGIFDVNTLAHYDPDIISYLDAMYGLAFGRNDNNQFEEESFDGEGLS
ncbi:DUF2185 domain-containing protein [Sphingobacterium sp. ML3W]|uniref:DUF2185 domain-containing protein n=1 Tax=Sphingobacterium sp. ML3W TaxID=1538644 RepID=UPI000691630F|nr:DUF2185 domain-containing protein [Sphingobacterium sp. ML3W]